VFCPTGQICLPSARLSTYIAQPMEGDTSRRRADFRYGAKRGSGPACNAVFGAIDPSSDKTPVAAVIHPYVRREQSSPPPAT
jgi:hypothetical protein